MTDSAITYSVIEGDFSDLEKVIKDGLNLHAFEDAQLTRMPVAISAKDNGAIIGGITGSLVEGSLCIKLLWVDKAQRRSGLGKRLMQRLECYAADQGCVTAFVDTMSYQAPDFYLKCGYTEVARVKKFYAIGHDRIFFQKDLV